MKNPLLLSLALASTVLLQALPHASRAGGEGNAGNGGAGVIKNGMPMTFYQAGVIVDPAPTEDGALADVPGIPELIDFIQNGASFLPGEIRRELVNQVVPSGFHKYYAVSAGRFDRAARARILEEFERVTGVSPEKLQILALTDTKTATTFLLPGFFKLDKRGQMAILFHEMYWLRFPESTYETVVAAETALLRLMDAPEDEERRMRFRNYCYGQTQLNEQQQMKLAVLADLRSGALKGLLQEDASIDFKDLLGEEFVSCLSNQDHKEHVCAKEYLALHLYQLRQKYPDSQFLKLFQQRMPTPKDKYPGYALLTTIRGLSNYTELASEHSLLMYRPHFRSLSEEDAMTAYSSGYKPADFSAHKPLWIEEKDMPALFPTPPEWNTKLWGNYWHDRCYGYVCIFYKRYAKFNLTAPLQGSLLLAPVDLSQGHVYLPARIRGQLCTKSFTRHQRFADHVDAAHYTPAMKRADAFPEHHQVVCKERTVTVGFTVSMPEKKESTP